VEIRRRQEADMERCVAMAAVVHQQDRYPRYLGHDLRSFLMYPGALGAWVADSGTDIVGHVALHPDSSEPVMALIKETTGLDNGDLGVIARLMVAPTARGAGVAQALLEVATTHAQALGRQPVLDVVSSTTAAIRLYERNGWTRLGTVTAHFPGGSLEEHVYLGPAGA
jgi:GNAT superfamily N-acetyltransferase